MILNKPSETTVSILGSEWKIILTKNTDDFKKCDGYTDTSTKEMFIEMLDPKEDFNKRDQIEYRKECVRHEIIHAFLYECGLAGSSLRCEDGWAQNEEMVDWLAIQYHKIEKIFKELKI